MLAIQSGLVVVAVMALVPIGRSVGPVDLDGPYETCPGCVGTAGSVAESQVSWSASGPLGSESGTATVSIDVEMVSGCCLYGTTESLVEPGEQVPFCVALQHCGALVTREWWGLPDDATAADLKACVASGGRTLCMEEDDPDHPSGGSSGAETKPLPSGTLICSDATIYTWSFTYNVPGGGSATAATWGNCSACDSL